MTATAIPIRAPDGSRTATWGGCAARARRAAASRRSGLGAVRDGRAVGSADREGRGDGSGCQGRAAPGCPGPGAARLRGARVRGGGVPGGGLWNQQHPAGEDQIGVGEGAAVRLGSPLVELVDLVPILGVAEEPLPRCPTGRRLP